MFVCVVFVCMEIEIMGQLEVSMKSHSLLMTAALFAQAVVLRPCLFSFAHHGEGESEDHFKVAQDCCC